MEGGAHPARFLPSVLLLAFIVAASGTGGCYSDGRDNYFEPGDSSTFQLVKLGNVNLTFLDNTHLEGHDGQDYVTLGDYKVETRFGMIESCSSVTFNNVDGILGFGWAGGERSAALLKTMTQKERPGWGVVQDADFEPMERKFAFTADQKYGEVQLGGYDEDATDGEMVYFPMATTAYGVNISSIKYGDGADAVELLDFNPDHPHARTSYVGQFDSGTTCLLLPNSTGLGYLKSSPFQTLLDLQVSGVERPLVYTLTDVNGVQREYTLPYTECVEPTPYGMILGDPWFRRWVVMHDLVDLDNPKMGLAPRNQAYNLHTEDAAAKARKKEVLAHVTEEREGAERRLMGEKEGGGKRKQKVEKLQARRAVEVPPGQTLAQVLAPGAVSKVALEAPTRVVYDVDIQIGTPPQDMRVIFDTGSYMLAVFSHHPPSLAVPLEGRGSIQKLKDLAKKGYKAMVGAMGAVGRARVQRKALGGQLQKLQEGERNGEGPDVRKALLIRKAIRKMRESGVKDAKLRDLVSVPIEGLQVGARDLDIETQERDVVSVSRVPALIGINAVLVAAVVALAMRLKKRTERREEGREGRELMGRGDEDYGALANEEGAHLL